MLGPIRELKAYLVCHELCRLGGIVQTEGTRCSKPGEFPADVPSPALLPWDFIGIVYSRQLHCSDMSCSSTCVVRMHLVRLISAACAASAGSRHSLAEARKCGRLGGCVVKCAQRAVHTSQGYSIQCCQVRFTPGQHIVKVQTVRAKSEKGITKRNENTTTLDHKHSERPHRLPSMAKTERTRFKRTLLAGALPARADDTLRTLGADLVRTPTAAAAVVILVVQVSHASP